MNINNVFIDRQGLAIENQKLKTLNDKTTNLEDAKKAAVDFEAFFLSQTFETMFNTISTDSMFGGGHAEKIFRSLLIDEYGKAMANNGGIGVANHVMDTILKLQETQNNNEGNNYE